MASTTHQNKKKSIQNSSIAIATLQSPSSQSPDKRSEHVIVTNHRRRIPATPKRTRQYTRFRWPTLRFPRGQYHLLLRYCSNHPCVATPTCNMSWSYATPRVGNQTLHIRQTRIYTIKYRKRLWSPRARINNGGGILILRMSRAVTPGDDHVLEGKQALLPQERSPGANQLPLPYSKAGRRRTGGLPSVIPATVPTGSFLFP